ncbi:unnamed protein product, partial [Amoebophrya sp. A120]|eukprot:GSA120T00023511001.1
MQDFTGKTSVVHGFKLTAAGEGCESTAQSKAAQTDPNGIDVLAKMCKRVVVETDAKYVPAYNGLFQALDCEYSQLVKCPRKR